MFIDIIDGPHCHICIVKLRTFGLRLVFSKGWIGLHSADWTDHRGSCECGRIWPGVGPCDSNSARTHEISVTSSTYLVHNIKVVGNPLLHTLGGHSLTTLTRGDG